MPDRACQEGKSVKPVRLEMNNSGAWKVMVRFDAADEGRTDEILNAAEQLANVVNDGAKKPVMTLRVVSDEAYPAVLMRHLCTEQGWRGERGEPV